MTDRYEEKARSVWQSDKVNQGHVPTCECSWCKDSVNAIAQALREEAARQREEDAKKADARVEFFQGCLNQAKKLMEQDGRQFHQQHIWEYQVLRDEAKQIASAIREAGEE